MSATRLALAAFPLSFASPAVAQEAESVAVEQAPVPEEFTPGDSITLALGAAYGPDYEGSDDYRAIPGAFVRADIGGVSIVTRGLKVFADIAPPSDGKVEFNGGPIAGVRLSRTGDVDDPRVDVLPELKTAIEVGAFAGVSVKQLTNPYDSLTFRFDAVKDVGGAHGDWVFTPNVYFSTPLSLKTFAVVSAAMDITGNDFNDYYFGITPTEATLHPELVPYDPDGGAKSYTIGLLVGQSLEETILEGWSLIGTVNYKRMIGDPADSPLVADFGSRTQWFAAAGIGYTF